MVVLVLWNYSAWMLLCGHYSVGQSPIQQRRSGMRSTARPKIGDRATSNVVVRLRTSEGRDEWLYCHSGVLAAGSKYFADRLSDDWPTCQILGSRYCVEVHCQEPDLSSHVTALRLLYAGEPCSRFGVRGALGVLRAGAHLGCPQITAACADYLESAPWDEADEEEIVRTVPCLGPQYERVLARLRPIDPAPVTSIFLSALHHATSVSTATAGPARELKSAAQEQLEYMLTEDDDAPLLSVDADDAVKSQVKDCVTGLLTRFSDFLSSRSTPTTSKQEEAPCSGSDELQQELHSFLSDISWLCQILCKLELMKPLVTYWLAASSAIVGAVETAAASPSSLKTRLKVVEISSKVLEAVAFGTNSVVLPPHQRRHAVDVWIGFAGRTKHLLDHGAGYNDDDDGDDAGTSPKMTSLDSEVWQGLESALVAMVLTLPSDMQAEVLAEWLLRSKQQQQQARYPDLTEAFEVWCYRSKVARRRLSLLLPR